MTCWLIHRLQSRTQWLIQSKKAFVLLKLNCNRSTSLDRFMRCVHRESDHLAIPIHTNATIVRFCGTHMHVIAGTSVLVRIKCVVSLHKFLLFVQTISPVSWNMIVASVCWSRTPRCWLSNQCTIIVLNTIVNEWENTRLIRDIATCCNALISWKRTSII